MKLDSEKSKVKKESTAVLFFAGGFAGCISKTVIAPLERVKILFQTRNQHYPYSDGVLKNLNNIKIKEGAIGWFKGNGATIIRIFPYAATQFLCYERYRAEILKATGSNTQFGNSSATFLAGSLAGTTSVLITYPLDLVRARLAVLPPGKNSYTGTFEGLKYIAKNEGLSGWFHGLRPTILGIIPYAGINFMAFDYLKKKTMEYQQKTELNTTSKLLCGGVSGAFGQTVSYPFNVVRRVMQTSNMEGSHLTGFHHKGSFEAIKFLIQKEGLRGLFNGVTIHYYKTVPAVAISFTTYEFLKKTFSALTEPD